MDNKQMIEEIHIKLNAIANQYGIKYYKALGELSGKQKIYIIQNEKRKFTVPIIVNADFETYNSIKEAVITVFAEYDIICENDENLKDSWGHKHNLYFMDKEEYEARNKEKEQRTAMPASQLNIGTLNADGSNIIVGNAVNTTQTMDNSKHENNYKFSDLAETKAKFPFWVSVIANIVTILSAFFPLKSIVNKAKTVDNVLSSADEFKYYFYILFALIVISSILVVINYNLIIKTWWGGFKKEGKMVYWYRPKKCPECNARMELKRINDKCYYVCKRNNEHKFEFDYTKI